MLTLLAWLLSACASVSQPSLPPLDVRPPAIPRLPSAARQPKTPPECLPTCSAGVSREFDSWLTSPTNAAQPGQPASGPMTR